MLRLLFNLFLFCGINEAFEILDIEENRSVNLVCPRSETSDTKLEVTYSDGKKEWYANFKVGSECATYSHMKCSKDDVYNTLTLSVSNRTRNIVSYSCGDNLVYGVRFYAGPKDVKCEQPTLVGTNITIKCTTKKVYPQMDCHFYDTFNNSTQGHVKYRILQSFDSPEYLKEQCSFTVRVSSLQEGNHQFSVQVRPKSINSFKAPHIVTPTINISPIKTKLDSSCPDGESVIKGYIKAGTSATCKCLKPQSHRHVFGKVYWSNANITDSYMSSPKLTVTYPNDHNKTFYCRASPLESNPMETKFQALFAFGPNSLDISHQNLKVELCSSVTIRCSASSSSVYPGVKFEWFLDNTDALVITPEISSSELTSVVLLTARLPGKYILTCRGTNSIFSDITTETHTVVIIEASKTVQPKITIDNHNHTLRQSLQEVNITCSVSQLSNISFSCLNKTLTKTATSVSFIYNMTKEENGFICNCISKYSCYEQKVVTSPIYLAYGPSEVKASTSVLSLELCKEAIFTVAVPQSDVYPGVSFSLKVDVPGSINWELTPENVSAIVKVRAEKAGEFSFNIQAFNTFNSNIRAQTAVKVIAYDSPSLKPTLLINNGELVIEGVSSQDVNITCRSPIGNVTITVSCLGTTVSHVGAELTVSKNLTRSDNGELCHCYVQYTPSCFHNETSTVHLNVTYQASITSLTVNEKPDGIELMEGDTVTLSCLSDSNPQPHIHIETEHVLHLIPSIVLNNSTTEFGQHMWQFVYQMPNISCRQSSTYTCVAWNGLFDVKVRQSVTVSVRCGVQLLDQSTKLHELKGKSINMLAANVYLIGYPKPNNLSLLVSQSKEPVSNRSYTLLYKDTQFFYGTLFVLIDKLTEEHVTLYTVNVGNGVGSNLEFELSFMEDDEGLSQRTVIVITGVSVGTLILLLIFILIFLRLKKGDHRDRNNGLPGSVKKSKKSSFYMRSSRYVRDLFTRHRKQQLSHFSELYSDGNQGNETVPLEPLNGRSKPTCTNQTEVATAASPLLNTSGGSQKQSKKRATKSSVAVNMHFTSPEKQRVEKISLQKNSEEGKPTSIYDEADEESVVQMRKEKNKYTSDPHSCTSTETELKDLMQLGDAPEIPDAASNEECLDNIDQDPDETIPKTVVESTSNRTSESNIYSNFRATITSAPLQDIPESE
ncbi:uncharacterized protein LOC106055233 isoform X2 [Biomphalaria glabrata]|uniref:Uncharacterized protein LOC106055233 isoform X2 n=1 Tax=Biomphalaria glabrata TaxID=6526 RepID=A0A9W2YU87_BIOGL|nr:uncharacterized protein LOC106055233 isoform X2 [Biomphalaria glabrata]